MKRPHRVTMRRRRWTWPSSLEERLGARHRRRRMRQMRRFPGWRPPRLMGAVDRPPGRGIRPPGRTRGSLGPRPLEGRFGARLPRRRPWRRRIIPWWRPHRLTGAVAQPPGRGPRPPGRHCRKTRPRPLEGRPGARLRRWRPWRRIEFLWWRPHRLVGAVVWPPGRGPRPFGRWRRRTGLSMLEERLGARHRRRRPWRPRCSPWKRPHRLVGAVVRPHGKRCQRRPRHLGWWSPM